METDNDFDTRAADVDFEVTSKKFEEFVAGLDHNGGPPTFSALKIPARELDFGIITLGPGQGWKKYYVLIFAAGNIVAVRTGSRKTASIIVQNFLFALGSVLHDEMLNEAQEVAGISDEDTLKVDAGASPEALAAFMDECDPSTIELPDQSGGGQSNWTGPMHMHGSWGSNGDELEPRPETPGLGKAGRWSF